MFCYNLIYHLLYCVMYLEVINTKILLYDTESITGNFHEYEYFSTYNTFFIFNCFSQVTL